MYSWKSSLKAIFVLCMFMITSRWAGAQILETIGRKVEQKVKDRANRKVDQTIDKGLDKAEGKVDESTRKKNKTDGGTNTDNNDNGNVSGGNNSKGGSSGVIAYKSKFDFVPGEKPVARGSGARSRCGWPACRPR